MCPTLLASTTDILNAVGWTPTGLAIVILAVGYAAVMVINAWKGKPQDPAVGGLIGSLLSQQLSHLQSQLTEHKQSLDRNTATTLRLAERPPAGPGADVRK